LGQKCHVSYRRNRNRDFVVLQSDLSAIRANRKTSVRARTFPAIAISGIGLLL
jgi:hypothetical protein